MIICLSLRLEYKMSFHKIAVFLLLLLFCDACLTDRGQAELQGNAQTAFQQKNLGGMNDFPKETQIFEAQIEHQKQKVIIKHNSMASSASSRSRASSLTNEIKYSKSQSKHQQRILQQSQPIQTSNMFIWGGSLLFQWLFVLTRNFILVGLFTNKIQLILPYLFLSEGFLMLAFWTCQKHYLTNLYAAIFSSYYDLFNALRLLSQPDSAANLPQLSQYGFSSIALSNLAGEIFVALLLLVFTVVSKVTTVCTRYEWMRRMVKNLRPLWNSYFFAIFPRVATFTGLHLRDFGHAPGIDTINGITCALLLLVMVFYLVMLFVQTNQIKSQASRQQSYEQLGLVSRIKYEEDFSFDCISWRNIYYPCMNYIRLFVYFLPIGLIWDCKELTYGAPIASQFLILIMDTTSSPYILIKDKILFPLLNFLLIAVQMGMITIGLAESAPYSELSETIEVALFTLMIILFGASLASTGQDFWKQIRCSEGEQRKHNSKNDTTHRFVHPLNKTGEVKRTEISQEEQPHHNEEKIQQYQPSFKQNTAQLTKMKIKKARTGNLPA